MRGFEPHRMHFRRLMTWHFFDWLFSNVLLMTSSCLFTFDASLSFRWLFLSLTTQTQVPWCAILTCMLVCWCADAHADSYSLWLWCQLHDPPWHTKTDQYSPVQDKTRQDFSIFFNKWQQNTRQSIQDKTRQQNTRKDKTRQQNTRKDKTRQQNTCKLPHRRDLTASIRARAV